MKKMIVLILCVAMEFCMAACGADSTPTTTVAPTETSAPAATVPTFSVTEPSPTEATDPAPEPTAPAEETTVPPTETQETLPTEPPVTEPSIQDSAAYQKILSLYNADQFDPAALEAFARWIDSQEGFMDQYPEGWQLSQGGWRSEYLTCFSPRTEDSRRYGFYMGFDGTLDVCDEPYEIFAMDISREAVAEMVYTAEDHIGVSDDLKEGFIDFLFYHDMYPASLFWPHYTTEWYFDWETYTSADDSQAEYITLYIKVWGPDAEPDDYYISSVFFNGTYIMEGWLDMIP